MLQCLVQVPVFDTTVTEKIINFDIDIRDKMVIIFTCRAVPTPSMAPKKDLMLLLLLLCSHPRVLSYSLLPVSPSMPLLWRVLYGGVAAAYPVTRSRNVPSLLFCRSECDDRFFFFSYCTTV